MDKDADSYVQRVIELPAAGLEDRAAVLSQMDDIAFDRLGRSFDFALAQSVFTHLDLNSIVRCLAELPIALSPQRRLYATYFEAPSVMAVRPIEHPRTDATPIVS